MNHIQKSLSICITLALLFGNLPISQANAAVQFASTFNVTDGKDDAENPTDGMLRYEILEAAAALDQNPDQRVTIHINIPIDPQTGEKVIKLEGDLPPIFTSMTIKGNNSIIDCNGNRGFIILPHRLKATFEESAPTSDVLKELPLAVAERAVREAGEGLPLPSDLAPETREQLILDASGDVKLPAPANLPAAEIYNLTIKNCNSGSGDIGQLFIETAEFILGFVPYIGDAISILFYFADVNVVKKEDGAAISTYRVKLDMKDVNLENTTSNGKGGCLASRGASVLTLERVVFKNCVADDFDQLEIYSDNFGGGAYLEDGTLEGYELTFENNYAEHGGGLYSAAHGAYIEDSDFISNVRPGNPFPNDTNMPFKGSGIFLDKVSYLLLMNVDVEQNHSYDGGGIYNQGVLEIRSSEIHSNSWDGMSNHDGKAIVEATKIYKNSGGIYVESGTVNVTHSYIYENSDPQNGGGFNVQNGTLNVVYSDINNNVGYKGGGIYLEKVAPKEEPGGEVNISYSNIYENTANVSGGGFYIENGTLNVDKSWIRGNKATGSGDEQGGGGVYVNKGDAKIQNSTIENNNVENDDKEKKTYGGGIYVYDGSVMCNYCTLVGNTAYSGYAAFVSKDPGKIFLYSSTIFTSRLWQEVNGEGHVLHVQLRSSQENEAEIILANTLLTHAINKQSPDNCNTNDHYEQINKTNPFVDWGYNYSDKGQVWYEKDKRKTDGCDFTQPTSENDYPDNLYLVPENDSPQILVGVEQKPLTLYKVTHPVMGKDKIPAGTLLSGAGMVCGYFPNNDPVLDQRGVPRDEACDVGAVEALPPKVYVEPGSPVTISLPSTEPYPYATLTFSSVAKAGVVWINRIDIGDDYSTGDNNKYRFGNPGYVYKLNMGPGFEFESVGVCIDYKNVIYQNENLLKLASCGPIQVCNPDITPISAEVYTNNKRVCFGFGGNNSNLSYPFAFSEEVNLPPTDISLSPAVIDENKRGNIGRFSAEDPNEGDVFEYCIVTDDGCKRENENFFIKSHDLVAKAPFDYETQNEYPITITVKDGGGLSFTKDFIIHINDVDEIAPTVTIDQGASQPDPTNIAPIVFDVVFNEAVTGFDNTDVNISGMASTPGITVVNSGDDIHFTVEVTGMANGETITASIPANAVQDLADNGCLASTSTDNSVTYKGLSTVFLSQGSYDGWVRESRETSSVGGRLNPIAKIFYLGDDSSNRQYRSILSFDTTSIPDNAVITRVTLKVKKAGLVGTNPFTTHGKLNVDFREGEFGTSAILQLTDFQAPASRYVVGYFGKKPVSRWYTAKLTNVAINMTGLTQFRLRFSTDDDNDFVADYFKFYSGNAGAASCPQLIVEYYVP